MPNPSLADLDREPAQQQQNNEPVKTDIKTGTGDEPSAADLEAARQRQALEDENARKAQQQQDDPNKPPIVDKTGDDATNDEPEGSVWDDVDALRGERLEFDWRDAQGVIPEEDRDTPRGILAREKALEGRAVERFEETLMEEDPRGYQYLLHRKAGGTDEDFFAKKTITLPDYERFKESVDLQTKVYGDSLRNAGVGEKQIKQLVDAAVKDKEIFEYADAAYRKQEQDEANSIKALNQQLEQERQQYDRNVQSLKKVLVDQVASKDMTIIVPEAKRAEFMEYVLSRVQYDQSNRTFLFAQPIDPKLLPRQLEAMFLQFTGGDLGGLVRREAQTDSARRLRRSLDRSKTTLKSQADTVVMKKTLGEL